MDRAPPGLRERPIKGRPRVELPERLVEALLGEHGEMGIEPEVWKLGRGYRHGRGIPWPIHARALEALDAAHDED